MKRTAIVFFIGLALSACADKKTQEKKLLDEVINIHDKVMGADERLMNDKMKLDTLVKQADFAGKDTAKMLAAKLTAADSAMNTWMYNFKTDYNGKTDDETINYLNGQKKQILAVDSQIKAATAESDKYLIKIKQK